MIIHHAATDLKVLEGHLYDGPDALIFSMFYDGPDALIANKLLQVGWFVNNQKPLF